MGNGEDENQLSPVVERLVMQMAADKANIARWSLKVAIFSYAILMIIIILVSLGIQFNIVAALGILGLSLIWLIGWRQGNQLRQRLYTKELSSLKEKPIGEAGVLVKHLTSREMKTLDYVAQGYSNKRIANELGVSEQTIKNYVSVILAKLNANDRTEAAVIAIKYGLISIK